MQTDRRNAVIAIATFLLFASFVAVSIALIVKAVMLIVGTLWGAGNRWPQRLWIVPATLLVYAAVQFVLSHLWVRTTSWLVARFR